MNTCPVAHELKPTLPALSERIGKLPVDERGYPVPFFVSWIEGKPEFRCADGRKLERCVKERLCWVCGEKLGKYMTFAIGPMCSINRISAEPPSHRDCCEWSVKGCPFLSKPQMVRRNPEELKAREGHSQPAGLMIERNPGVTMLWTTLAYKLTPDHNRRALFSIGEPEHISWWREGRPATRAEVLESIESGLPSLVELCVEPGSREALEAAKRRAMKLIPA